MKQLLTALFILSALFIASCTAATTTNNSDTGPVNYASNPGFESGLDGWSSSEYTGTGMVYLTNDCKSGSNSVYILCTNYNETNSLVQYVAYQMNKTYLLSAYLKDVPANYKCIEIELCDMSSNKLTVSYSNVIVMYGWTGWTNVGLVLGPTNIPGFIKVSFCVIKNNGGTAELFVDDVVLTNY